MKSLCGILVGFAALGVLLGFAIGGCGPAVPPTVADQPTIPRGYYDEVWVEPKILHADSVFTLIRAERKDSVFVRTNEINPHAWEPALEFMIRPDTCFVAVTLHFLEIDRPSLPLVARYLPGGCYKLTVNDPLKFGDTVYSGSCSLNSLICGQKQIVPVIR